MADNNVFYQIIVSGAKRDYRISRNKTEVNKLVTGYKADPKVERVQVTYGTKNAMKSVSDWQRSGNKGTAGGARPVSKKATTEANSKAPIRGVEHGQYIGPTGRKRRLYTAIAYNRQKERRGSTTAYGYQGIREAKKDFAHDQAKHFKHPIWLRYDTFSRKV